MCVDEKFVRLKDTTEQTNYSNRSKKKEVGDSFVFLLKVRGNVLKNMQKSWEYYFTCVLWTDEKDNKYEGIPRGKYQL